MLSSDWPKCIVTFFDLPGIKAKADSGEGSAQMIAMRTFAIGRINNGLPLHSHGYVWNDSIMLLSYRADPPHERRQLVLELSEFKASLDNYCGEISYAISVQGLAFPQDEIGSPVFDNQIAAQPRAIPLKTSSWAMANCFIIEKELGKKRAHWYIDSRITAHLNLPAPFASESIMLLPRKKAREIHLYKGYFHTEA